MKHHLLLFALLCPGAVQARVQRALSEKVTSADGKALVSVRKPLSFSVKTLLP